ncbi:MAG: hypothetical protein ACRDPS_04215 [Nocardioides sp.]|uniref:hypothetical protein n=1 Tax=Nocardioides sp. TaxID=35761 RepID=UPI003D6C534C
MQSKQIAVAGILSGAVMTGLGVVVLLASLAEAEQPKRDPVTGYGDTGTNYSEVEPLPLRPSEKSSRKPSADPSDDSRGAAERESEGGAYEPGEPAPARTAEPDDPAAPSASTKPTGPGGSTPTSGPTRTSEPEPTTEPSDPDDPTTEPEPSETPTPTSDPDPQALG